MVLCQDLRLVIGVFFSIAKDLTRFVSYTRTIRVPHAPQPKNSEGRYQPTVDDEACSKLWAVYINEAQRYDEDLLKGWKDDMDGMLLFSALYSASLTAFLIESYQTLQDDPAQSTVVLLTQITQQLAAALNGTNVSIPPPVPAVFDPPASSIICNFLWFLSLALALTCSLLATFVQQWTRDFIYKTHLKSSPVRQARIIAFTYFGLRDFGMHTFVDIANATGNFLTRRHGIFRQGDSLTEVMLEKSYKSSTERSDRDHRALSYTIKSLADDKELLPFIEAIPDAIYSSSRPMYTGPNTELILPLLESVDPETNIMSRINRFMHRYQAWTDRTFREQASMACPKALWSLAWMFLNLRQQNRLNLRPENIRAYRNFAQDIVSYAPILLSLHKKYAYSALAVLRLSWLYGIRDSIAKVEEMFPRLPPATEPSVLQGLQIFAKKYEFLTFAVDMLGEIRLLEVNYGYGTLRGCFPTPYAQLTASVNRKFHALDLLRKPREITSCINELKADEAWRPLCWHILHEYILLSLDSIFATSTLPHEFEVVCNLVYPPGEVDSVIVNNHAVLGPPNLTEPLLTLKKNLAENTKMGAMTDTLIIQYLKLFVSAESSKSARDIEKEAESRSFVLWYFTRTRSADEVTHRKTLEFADLLRVMKCILEEWQHSGHSLCLKAAFLSMVGFPRFLTPWPDLSFGDVSANLAQVLVYHFPWILWKTLREPPSNLHEHELYPFVRTLADVRVCAMVDTYEPRIAEAKLELYHKYLPQHIPIFSAASKAHRETLMVSILARCINLSYEQKFPSQFGISIRKLCGAENYGFDFTRVYETGQLLFAKSFAKLIDTLLTGEFDSEPGYLSSSILGDFLNLSKLLVTESEVALWSWKHWITSVRCARKFIDALEKLRKSEYYHEHAEGYDNLLVHCREVVSEHITQFRHRHLGKKKSQVLASKDMKQRRGILKQMRRREAQRVA
ncbi:hypothetical protein VKT23_012712 [Stygiomarasmius scandens]|uniref:DUF6535 domain-containing protein n=1 Tax=Marasmiellus scandens TaxID=2682957 RepID=A0ABR1J506_9AGAR